MNSQQSAVATRGRLTDYALWMFRDFAFERLIPIVIVSLLMGFPIYKSAGHISGDLMSQTFLPMMVNGMLSTFLPIVAFLAVYRLVSADRGAGYFRLQFAKPVSVSFFYLQRFVVNCVALLACMVLFGLLLRLAGIAIPFTVLLFICVVMYVGFGGFHFLISVLTRYDVWVSAIIWFVSMGLYVQYANATGIAKIALHILPPAHLLSDRTQLYHGFAIHNMQSALWIMGYGVVCLVLGMWLLRRRPLAG